MKKLFTFLCLALLVPAAWAKQVPQSDAQQIAETFYQLNNPSGITDPEVKSVTAKSWENVPSLYIFRFATGGFVLVAADDASIPILGYSFNNDIPETIDNPAVSDWLDNYSREIGYIITNNLDNSETLKEWSSIQQNHPLTPTAEVLPLLTTTWDQGCFYNTACPSDGAGPCGHVLTGCVATAMAQIMKYHNFPPQGVSQHTYSCGVYGEQSVNFGNTTYDWPSMPNSVTSDNPAVATLNYQAGVAVDMAYGPGSSGAMINIVPGAMVDYFNYSPDIDFKYKDNYTNVEDFKNLIRTDLDEQLPVYYAGFGPNYGHAFVCDGYRMSDGTFHFNWGWSGSADGYYAIGYLNPGSATLNGGNSVVVHLKPYNPNLIVRIITPADKVIVGTGENVEIKANVARGSSNLMKIFIDSVEKCTATGDSISFTWTTSATDAGSHVVKAWAMNATDTVYYKILVNVNGWIPQASGFPAAYRAISSISAIDSNVIWASAWNANNLSGPCSDFTRTTNGGTTWNPGVITNTNGLITSMIFAIDSLKAYTAMYRISGTKPMGVYVTSNGGANWTRQTTALYNNTVSAPDIVHFFNANDGVVIGDPILGEYEIYTTSNGGTNWIRVPGLYIPNPLTNEMGILGWYSAVQDTVWFGTNLGRVYRSADKGLHWTVSTASALSGMYVKPTFRNGSHGLLQDENSGAGLLCETFDGGTTWSQVMFTGPNYGWDMAYVPGTENTWVRSGASTGGHGIAYSFDGGHDWTDFPGTAGSEFYNLAWLNDHCGWAGGVNTSATAGGFHKFTGILTPPPAPRNVQPVANNHNVNINWDIPSYDPAQMTLQGYNVNRNGIKINSGLVTDQYYNDQNVMNGQYTYCVSAQYNIGGSLGSCNTVDITVGIAHNGDQPPMMIYPNPAHGRVLVQAATPSAVISIFDQSGNTMPVPVKNLLSGLFSMDVSGLAAGIYVVSGRTAKGLSRSKLVIY